MSLGNIFAGGLLGGQAASQRPQIGVNPGDAADNYQYPLMGTAVELKAGRSRYAAFSMRVEECTGGFVVLIGEDRHIIRDLSEIGALAATHFATLALERT